MIPPTGLRDIPVDNLYKFVAIVGFIGVLFFQVLAHVEYRRIDEHSWQNLALLDSAIVRLQGNAAPLLGDIPGGSVRADSLAELIPKVADSAIRDFLVRFDVQRENINTRRDDAQVDLNFYNAMTAASALLAMIGFGLWYYRTQRHMDTLLRAQAERAAREQQHSPFE